MAKKTIIYIIIAFISGFALSFGIFNIASGVIIEELRESNERNIKTIANLEKEVDDFTGLFNRLTEIIDQENRDYTAIESANNEIQDGITGIEKRIYIAIEQIQRIRAIFSAIKTELRNGKIEK
jgi:septation ring formation regulator EzrA